MDKRLFWCLAACATAAVMVFSTDKVQARHYNTGLSTHNHGMVTSCDDLNFEFDDHDAAHAEQHFTIPKSASVLEVDAARNGGVQVAGWTGNDYAISACKAAASDSLLREISVSASGNHVTANGPTDGDWTVYLIVKAPQGSNLSLKAHNGPIGLRDVSGKVVARSENGPIAVVNCSGEIDAQTVNGPISMSGDGGNLKLETQNGPIHVALAGDRWNAGGVTAHTENGPLSLEVPANFESGVRVEMSGRSPVRCRASQCSKSNRTWDDDSRYIEFGGANPTIKMSTVNGPVSVDSGRGEL
ncbi:MAG TPA: DUF4097 family beta strand repeat-containing protein [Terriglobia bacterium]|nr:DUF4097 family beta strand repeat-containing protein [Terriglobia bacterium]